VKRFLTSFFNFISQAFGIFHWIYHIAYSSKFSTVNNFCFCVLCKIRSLVDYFIRKASCCLFKYTLTLMVILNKQRIRGSFSFLLTNLIPDAVNLCAQSNFLEMDAATRRQLKKNRKKVLQVSLLVYQ
jgi:hypothetical protein